MDNVSTSGQASSVYFSTQGVVNVGTCNNQRCAVKLTQLDCNRIPIDPANLNSIGLAGICHALCSYAANSGMLKAKVLNGGERPVKSTQLIATRPESNEYAPYYGKYVSLVPDGDMLVTLEKQLPETLALLARSGGRWRFPLCPGEVERERVARTCHRCRTCVQLSRHANCPQRQDSSAGLRAG